MKVSRCDKCGKFFDYEGGTADGSVFDNIRIFGGHLYHLPGEPIDLCRVCAKELLAILGAWWIGKEVE